MSLLGSIVALPLLGAVGLAAVPRHRRVLVRGLPLMVTLLVVGQALRLFVGFDPDVGGYQFVTTLPGLGAPSLGVTCRLGVDGLSLGLILMGALVAFAATCASWEIRDREKEFYILLLTLVGGILGAFASLNLFFFYAFHELALIPTFILIGVWGRGERKNYATFKMTLYLSLGALITLVGLLALYLESRAASLDLEAISAHLRNQPLPLEAQRAIFPLLLFGFGILVALWPFHTWAPLGYASAPTAAAMLHAGVVKKFGLYGLIRIALPLLPEAAQEWAGWIAVLCLGNILYCGLVTMRQRDLNLLIGNASVAHMGFIFLGIATLTGVGLTGAVVAMIAHGLLAALSFGLSGFLFQRTGTLDLGQLGGLQRRLPFLGTALTMALFASCGLPGFANFIGEVLVFFGAWKVFPVPTLLAVWGGLLIGAIYALRAIREMLLGALPGRWAGLGDAPSAWRKLPFVLLLAALIVFGVFPGLLTTRITPSVAGLAALPGSPAPAAEVASR